MRRFHGIIITVIALAALTACEGESALAVLNQEDAIEKFITNKYADYEVVRNGGSNRVVLTPGIAVDSAAVGDSVTVLVDGYVFNNGPSLQFLSDSTTLMIGGHDVLEGLSNGLKGVLPGEESYIIFSAKYGYYNAAVGIVPPMSPLMFHTLVTDIKKKK